MKSKDRNMRVDKKLISDLTDVALVRANNKLCKFNPREMSFRKMSELLTRTDSYKKALEELKFKPERKK